MKVSKIVREYIADKVEEARDTAWDKDEIIQEHQTIVSKLNKDVKALQEKHCQEWDELAKTYGTEVGFSHYPLERKLPTYEAAEQRKRFYRNAAEEKTKDILLTLELGGTKTDLDNMLKSLKF